MDVGRMTGVPPVAALLPALGRLDALLRAVGDGGPAAATLATPDPGEPPSRLTRLGEALELEVFDLDALLLALAPELDRGYGPLFAALQGDPFAWRPSVDVLLEILCATDGERLGTRSRLGPRGPLIGLELIRLTPFVRPGAAETALVEVDPRIVDHLLGEDGPDPRLADVCRLLSGAGADADDAHVALWEQLGDGGVLVLEGPPAAGGIDAARALAARAGRPLLLAEPDRAAARGLDVDRALRLAIREAAIQDALLGVAGDHVDLAGWARWHRGPLVVVTGDARALEGRARDVVVAPIALPGPVARAATWARELGEIPEGADVSALASRFRLNAEEVGNAVRAARGRARLREATGGDGGLTSADLFAAARGRCGAGLEALARKVDCVYGWDDIVLPDDSRAQLREICERVEQRDRVIESWGFGRTLGAGLGVSALFAGSSGTGKTMAAGVVANELQLDLLAIDLATIVSKYIGETSKNLDRIFGAAEDANAILFFDEADALFGKRSEVRDSHDRYANVEIAYLLQKMEAYDGVAILATNLRQNLDDAFARRLAFTVHFPFPGACDRLEIWQRVWPAEVRLDDDVDLTDLADRFRLSGGNIRNAALAAAFLAATDGAVVRREHLLRAIRREYQKLGRGLSEAELTGVEPELDEVPA